MRIISLDPKYTALIHDLIKTATILLVVEAIQTLVLGEKFLDNAFTRTIIDQLIGIMLFHLVVDGIIGAGPECCHINKLLESEPAAAPMQ
jgi:hypothetical protein